MAVIVSWLPLTLKLTPVTLAVKRKRDSTPLVSVRAAEYCLPSHSSSTFCALPALLAMKLGTTVWLCTPDTMLS